MSYNALLITFFNFIFHLIIAIDCFADPNLPSESNSVYVENLGLYCPSTIYIPPSDRSVPAFVLIPGLVSLPIIVKNSPSESPHTVTSSNIERLIPPIFYTSTASYFLFRRGVLWPNPCDACEEIDSVGEQQYSMIQSGQTVPDLAVDPTTGTRESPCPEGSAVMRFAVNYQDPDATMCRPLNFQNIISFADGLNASCKENQVVTSVVWIVGETNPRFRCLNLLSSETEEIAAAIEYRNFFDPAEIEFLSSHTYSYPPGMVENFLKALPPEGRVCYCPDGFFLQNSSGTSECGDYLCRRLG